MDRILLDPNNYRFQNLPSWHAVAGTRFAESTVQQRAAQLLRDTRSFELSLLKDSIRENGYVPLEQIVVRLYASDPSYFLVIEGNRRIAAMRWLLEDEAAGVCELPIDTQEFLSKPEVLIFDDVGDGNEQSIDILLAIRHVSGVKMWGAYQQARLIVRLMEAPDGGGYTKVGQQLGMSGREVARRFRASMALHQMEQDDEFSAYVTPEMHGLFQETFANPEVRDWLVWDESSRRYTNAANLELFYSLVSDTEEQAAQIKAVFDIRVKLKAAITTPPARESLIQNRNLENAYQLALTTSQHPAAQGAFENAIRQMSQVVDSLTLNDVQALPDGQVALLRELNAKLAEFLEAMARLRDDVV